MSIKPLCFLLFPWLIISFQPVQAQQTQFTNPEVQKAKHFRKTKPLRDITPVMPGQRDRSWKDNIIRNEENKKAKGHQSQNITDPVLQHAMGTNNTRTIEQNFDGISNVNGVYPPDTQGDVGPGHYFQMINLSFSIYDKSGSLLYGPADNSTLWDGFIGPWTGTNDGDPIVLYDELADRWLASQFAVNTSDGTYWQLIAISETSDPTGSYYQYAFQFPAFNDYPKFGVWPDAYYASFNIFGSYFRAAAAAFERDSMLAGDPNASMILFDLPNGSDPASMLPSDFDGTPPPAGTPNYFTYFNDDVWGYPTDELRIWEFSADWATPSNSTFTESKILQPAAFDWEICSAYRGRCIDQQGTSRKLEALSDRMMYRLQYRNFGTHESLLTNHTVDAGGGVAGIRWYEIRDTHNGNGWEIHQEGTFSPDSDHRWMGSIAMDGNGNIALGYSVSSSSMYPAIRFTGRFSTDPPGQMTITEEEILAGTGAQTGSACRWGDYSMMAVDPSSPTTFWYTNEYLQTTGTAPWKTRIASFWFQPPMPSVNAGPDQITCEQDPVTLNPTVGNQSSVEWNTTGDGSFDDPALLNATYTPGTGDVTNDSVLLILTAYALAPLTDSVLDTTKLTILSRALAYSGNDTTICENASLATQGYVENADSVLWNTSGDGTFDDSTLVSALYTPGPADIDSGSVTLSLTAYSISPCTGDSTDIMTLSIQYLPEANAGTDDTICEGETYPLSGTASNHASVFWTTTGDGIFSNDSILDPVYTPGIADISNGTVTLTLTANAVFPCATDSSHAMELTIDELPTVDAGVFQTIPYGTSTTLSGAVSGGSGSFSYLWTPQDKVIDPTNLTTETVMLEATTIFTLTVTDLNTGCAGDDTVTINITGGPLAAEAMATPDNICEGDSTQLDVIPSGGSGTYSYAWTSDPPGFSDSIQNPTAYPPGNTTYIVTVDDGYSTINSSVDVTVFNEPYANAGMDTTICHDETITLYGTADNYSYLLWESDGDGFFNDPGILDATYTPGTGDIENGQAVLSLIAYPISPCMQADSDDLVLSIDVCSGMKGYISGTPDIHIQPNPNKGIFTLKANGLSCTSVKVDISDILGNHFYAKVFQPNKGSLDETLNMKSFPKGIYFLRIACGKQLLTKRLITH